MACFILLLFFLAVARGQECSDGLLIVGGENQDGPLDTIHLLTSAGWCDNVKLPPLLEPISNPAVFVKHSIVVVCGFSTFYCQYAQAGSTEWQPFIWGSHPDTGIDYVGPNETNYKLAGVSDGYEDLVMLTSTAKENYRDGRYYFNPLQLEDTAYNPSGISVWQRRYGAVFRLEDRHVDGSCLVTVDTNTTDPYDAREVLLTGGWGKYVDCGQKCSSTQSDPGVGIWSMIGNPPDWESGVVDDMLFAREDHGCVGYMGGVLVGGGALYETYFHFMGTTERITVLQSTEFWNGNQWQEVGSLLEARMDFKMLKFCGNVIAVGGRQYDLHQSLFLDTIEILEGNGADVYWVPSDIKLPNAMAKFGMAQVSDADHFCGSEPFHCQEDGLFPSGPCENGFWSCEHGIEHFLECAKPLVFNPEINNCDFQSNTPGCNAH